MKLQASIAARREARADKSAIDALATLRKAWDTQFRLRAAIGDAKAGRLKVATVPQHGERRE